jgi:hypothetical protein
VSRRQGQPYEIRSGGRVLSVSVASTPQYAVFDFLRSMGCRDNEIVRLAGGEVSWRGAVYAAVPVDEPNAAPSA